MLRIPRTLAVSRSRFDAALVDAAVSAGATFSPETHAVQFHPTTTNDVQLETRQGDQRSVVHARVMIVADGLAGTTLARRAPTIARPDSRVGAGAIAVAAPAFFRPNVLYMACGRAGYVGMVRLEDGRLDIAAALDARSIQACRGIGAVIAEILSRQSAWPEIAGLAHLPWRGTPALTRVRKLVADRRVFVVGDATGYVEPFTGEGMGWALQSAVHLGPIASHAVDQWDDRLAHEWTKLHGQLLRSRQRLCRATARVLRHPWLASAIVHAVRLVPPIARPFFALLNRPFSRSAA
jgi:flavin-dependent dehydrogenase